MNLTFKKIVLPWFVCFIAALFYCYEYLLRIAPGTMVEHLQLAFGTKDNPLDATMIGHLSAFYYYAYAPMQLPVGVMMDKYGPRNILTIAVVCCTLGAGLFSSTSELAVAQLGRFLMGFGSAFAFVGVLKLATNWLPPNRFAFMAGLTTTLGMIGAMSGETWLTALTNTLGWQETMYYSCIIGAVLAPLVWLVIRDEPTHSTSWAIPTHNQSYGELFAEIVTALRNPQIWLNGLIGCLMITPTVVFAELWGSLYLRTVFNFSIDNAPRVVAAIFLGWAIGGPLMGIFSDRIGRRKVPLILGCLATTIILSIFLFYPELSHQNVYWLLFFLGAFSSAQVIVFAVGRENCPDKLAGTVIAVTNFVVVFSALFQILVGKLLDHFWSGIIIDNLKVYSARDYHYAMMVLPCCTLCALFLCFMLRETYCKAHE